MTPWTVAHQASLSMGFPRQEYWSELPFPSPGDLPNPGIKSGLLHWQADSLPLSHLGSPVILMYWKLLCARHFTRKAEKKGKKEVTIKHMVYQIRSDQSLSRVQLFAIPWIAAHQASLSITNPWSLLKFMSIEPVDAIQPSHPLSSPSPAFNPSQHQSLFQWVNSSHEVAKVLEFQL